MEAKPNEKPKATRYQPYNCVLDPNQGKGALYLGDVHAIDSKRFVVGEKLSTVVCCIKDFSMKSFQSRYSNVRVVCFPLRDKADQDITQYFEQAFVTIDEGRKHGNVLVFCFAGVSRSASIVLSYIMREQQLTFSKALTSVRLRRAICPNKGFEAQLMALDRNQGNDSMAA